MTERYAAAGERRRPSAGDWGDIATLAVVFLVYLMGAWGLFYPRAFCSIDAGAKFLQLDNLRLTSDGIAHDVAYPGADLDPTMAFAEAGASGGFLRVRDGRLYFHRLPLFPLLTLPFYRLLGFPGLYVLPALSGAMIGLLSLRLLPARERHLSMWFVTAFGSPVFLYSMLFWEHTLAASLGLAAFWLVLTLRDGVQRSPILRGLSWLVVLGLLGVATFLRLEMAIFSAALLLAYVMLVERRRWEPVLVALGAGLALLSYLLVHRSTLGQALPDNATYLFRPLAYLRGAGWWAIRDLLVGPPTLDALDTGWWGMAWAVAALGAIGVSWWPKERAGLRSVRLVLLALTGLLAAAALFSPTGYQSAHGLLFTTPWAILGLVNLRSVWRDGGARLRLIAVTTTLGLLGYAVGIVLLRGSSPHGGFEWGSRFAMIYYPLLALMAFRRPRDKGHRGLVLATVIAALVFLGLGFQIRGMAIFRQCGQASDQLNHAVMAAPVPNIVTDQWWAPLQMAPVYGQKPIFVTDTREDLVDWTVAAHRQGVGSFLYLSHNPQLIEEADGLLRDEGIDLTIEDAARHAVGWWIYRIGIDTR